MYKNNSRDCVKIKVCSPLQLLCNLTRSATQSATNLILIEEFKLLGTPTTVHYSLPLHLKECFVNLSHKNEILLSHKKYPSKF